MGERGNFQSIFVTIHWDGGRGVQKNFVDIIFGLIHRHVQTNDILTYARTLFVSTK